MIDFIMSLIKDVVEKFLSDLADLPPGIESYAILDDIISPALEGERNLRMAFATNSPSILSNPHIGLINIFSISPTPITIGRDRMGVNLDSTHLFPFPDFKYPL